MPSLGADMESGTLVEWKVKPGDAVKRGQIIAIIGTDKADVEAEVYEDGVIEKLVAQPGEKVPVGTVLAQIAGGAAAAPTAPVPEPSRIRASPLARRLAAELGVDLRTVKGTGPDGVIEKHDVEAARSKPPAPEKPKEEAKPAPPTPGIRRAIALAMAKSNREIPHYYLETSIDMQVALRWLEEANRQRPIKDRILPAALLLKAVARALAQVPELNGFWVDDELRPSEAIHIGVAIALRQGGLIAPAVHHVDLKSVDEVMAALRDLITRTRSGLLRSSELTDSTITVTNLGDLGVEAVFGVIYPPQVALVGLGKITETPWAENGTVGVRPVLRATLAGDHRATDGRRGAQFLDALGRMLREPEKL